MIFNFLKASYEKLKKALFKTSSVLGYKLRALFTKPLDEEALEQLEKILYEADLGVKMSTELTEKIRKLHVYNPNLTPDELLQEIKKDLIEAMTIKSEPLKEGEPSTLKVILVVGVNGNGKTTSTAKLARFYLNQNKKVLLAAADTFRAAAIEQLDRWSKQLDVEIVKGLPGADPAAVAFDAVTAAIARKSDILIIDTAGRLHTKAHLMQELEKIKRSCNKVLPGSPHEILLVLDATTGQNAIDQAAIFHAHTPISGLILTKLDGTAKGGITIGLQKQLGISIKYIGFGEAIDDFDAFNAETFVEALLGSD